LALYRYNNVPQKIWEGLKNAESKGHYVAAMIRPVYDDFQQFNEQFVLVRHLNHPMPDWDKSVSSLDGVHGWF